MGLRTARPAAMLGGLLCTGSIRPHRPAAPPLLKVAKVASGTAPCGDIWDSSHERDFPWIFATALLPAGSAFLYAGVKLTSTAWTLKTSGEQTTATIERVEVREAHVRKDDAPAIVHYYTRSSRSRPGTAARSRSSAREERRRGPRQASDPIEIRYRHDDPSVAAPVNGSPLGIQGPILIIAGLALLAFGAR